MLTARIAVLGLSLSLGLAGCTGSSAPQPSTSTSSSPSASAAAVTPASLAITAQELGTGWQEKTIPGGTQVSGQVTLDLCGGGYASEGLRTARMQVAFKHGPAMISNEVVQYRTGGARMAYEELKQRVAQCPAKPVTMPEAGAPRVRWHLTPIHVRGVAAPLSVSVRATVAFKGKTHSALFIYQFAGDWLSAVYSENTSKASLAAAEHAASIAAKKLNTTATGTAA